MLCGGNLTRLLLFVYLLCRMNKPEIKEYLQSIYGVKVDSVNTKIVQGALVFLVYLVFVLIFSLSLCVFCVFLCVSAFASLDLCLCLLSVPAYLSVPVSVPVYLSVPVSVPVYLSVPVSIVVSVFVSVCALLI